MKAPNFRYIRPQSLSHAYRILEENTGAAVPLAGGQSLLAGLNMRLSSPQLLVDIGELTELAGCSQQDGEIRLGALMRHRELLESELIRTRLPLLAEAASHVGHLAIRNRGTLGGSLAYADPAAELPACSVALAATLLIGSSRGEREVKAESFFTGLFQTDLRPGELILGVRFPAPDVQPASGFAELARRRGDFALVGVTAVATVERARVHNARLVYFGCIDRARLARSVSAAIEGLQIPLADDAGFEAALADDLQPDDTPDCRGTTKLHLAKVLTRRVINRWAAAEADHVG